MIDQQLSLSHLTEFYKKAPPPTSERQASSSPSKSKKQYKISMAAQTMASATTDGLKGKQLSGWYTEPYIAETNFDDAMMWNGDRYTLKDYVWLNMNCAESPYFGHIPVDYGEKMKDSPPVGIKPFQEPAGETAPGLVLNDEDFAIGEIEESVSPESPESPEGLKSIKVSESTGESESHEEREASEKQESPDTPEELNSLEEPIGEELESTENSKSPKEPRSPEGPAEETARNENRLLDGKVIEFIGKSFEPVATTKKSSDKSKDSYESDGSTSLSDRMYFPTYFVQN